MSLTQQIVMLGTLMLTSKGVAGVPRAVLVVLLATASIFGLPEEPIFVLLGVDALMDMGRTTINVVGNCLASAVVARWEGEFRAEAASPEAVAGADRLQTCHRLIYCNDEVSQFPAVRPRMRGLF